MDTGHGDPVTRTGRFSTETELVAACLRMDDAAWRIFVREYRAICLAIARYHLVAADFDELFSNFVVKLLGSLSGKPGALQQYRPGASLRTFLSAVFLNVIIDHQRRKCRSPLVDGDLAPIIENCADNSNCGHAQAAEHADTMKALANVVRELPDDDRALLDLYYHDNMSMQQIGAVRACNKSSVQRHLQRILDAVRSRLLPLLNESQI